MRKEHFLCFSCSDRSVFRRKGSTSHRILDNVGGIRRGRLLQNSWSGPPKWTENHPPHHDHKDGGLFRIVDETASTASPFAESDADPNQKLTRGSTPNSNEIANAALFVPIATRARRTTPAPIVAADVGPGLARNRRRLLQARGSLGHAVPAPAAPAE